MYTVYVCFYNLGKAKMIPKMLLIPSAFLTRLAKKWNSKAGSNWRSSFEVTQYVATKCKNLQWFFAHQTPISYFVMQKSTVTIQFTDVS